MERGGGGWGEVGVNSASFITPPPKFLIDPLLSNFSFHFVLKLTDTLQ